MEKIVHRLRARHRQADRALAARCAARRRSIRLDLPRERRATELTVQIAPSLATTMLDALPYLIEFPYGCTEQTMSRFLPAAIVARTLETLGLDPGEPLAEEGPRRRHHAPAWRGSTTCSTATAAGAGGRTEQRRLHDGVRRVGLRHRPRRGAAGRHADAVDRAADGWKGRLVERKSRVQRPGVDAPRAVGLARRFAPARSAQDVRRRLAHREQLDRLLRAPCSR